MAVVVGGESMNWNCDVVGCSHSTCQSPHSVSAWLHMHTCNLMSNAGGNALRKGLPSILNSFLVDSCRRASLSLLDSVLATVGQLVKSGCVISYCECHLT